VIVGLWFCRTVDFAAVEASLKWENAGAPRPSASQRESACWPRRTHSKIPTIVLARQLETTCCSLGFRVRRYSAEKDDMVVEELSAEEIAALRKLKNADDRHEEQQPPKKRALGGRRNEPTN